MSVRAELHANEKIMMSDENNVAAERFMDYRLAAP